MEIVFKSFALFYFILFNSANVLCARAKNNSATQVTEYELKLDTKEDTNDCKHMKVSVDGLESHMLFGKSNHVANKVVDGTHELWKKQDAADKCIGSLLTYKNSEKKLALLVVMKKIKLTGGDPLEILFFKSNNNQWQKIDKEPFFQEVGSLKPDTSSFNPVDFDVSDETKGAELLSPSESPIKFGLRLFLSNDKEKIGNLTEGTSKIFEGQANGEGYPLYFLLGKKDENKKFGFAVLNKNNQYEEVYFKYNNNQWEKTDFSSLKTYIISGIGLSGLRGR